MKIGIALAGGGAKGAAHLGIIHALEIHGIKADMYAGTSAGSIVASAKAMGYGNQFILKMMDEINNDFIDYNYWGILRSLPFKFRSLESVAKGENLKKFLDRHFDQHIKDVFYPLAVISGDLKTSCQVVFSSHDIPVASELDNLIKVYTDVLDLKLGEIIYASAAIPGIFPPKIFDDRMLVDGSIVNVLPANALSAMGADKIIAIDLNTQIKPKDITGILSIMGRSVNMMIQQNVDLSLGYANNHMLLTPDLSSIDLLDFNRTKEAYVIGYQYGRAIASKVYEFIYKDA